MVPVGLAVAVRLARARAVVLAGLAVARAVVRVLPAPRPGVVVALLFLRGAGPAVALPVLVVLTGCGAVRREVAVPNLQRGELSRERSTVAGVDPGQPSHRV